METDDSEINSNRFGSFDIADVQIFLPSSQIQQQKDWNYLGHFSQITTSSWYWHYFSLPSSDLKWSSSSHLLLIRIYIWSVNSRMLTQHPTLPHARCEHNKLCKKLSFKEVVRTESRKDKIMLEAWQKCSEKQTFSGIAPIYYTNMFVPLNQVTASEMLFLPHLWLRKPWQQKYPPGFQLRLTGTYLLFRHELVMVKQSFSSPDLHCMYGRKRELWFYVEIQNPCSATENIH